MAASSHKSTSRPRLRPRVHRTVRNNHLLTKGKELVWEGVADLLKTYAYPKSVFSEECVEMHKYMHICVFVSHLVFTFLRSTNTDVHVSIGKKNLSPVELIIGTGQVPLLKLLDTHHHLDFEHKGKDYLNFAKLIFKTENPVIIFLQEKMKSRNMSNVAEEKEDRGLKSERLLEKLRQSYERVSHATFVCRCDRVLRIAVLEDCVEVVKILDCEFQMDIDKEDSRGKTPLIIALENDSIEVAEYLFQTGRVDLYHRDHDENTPMKLGRIDYLLRLKLLNFPNFAWDFDGKADDFIIEHYWDKEFKRKESIFSRDRIVSATMEGEERYFLRYNIPMELLHSSFEDGDTLLHIAVRYQHVSIVTFLIQNHVDVNVQNERNETPLHVAVQIDVLSDGKENKKISKLVDRLISAGADRDLRNLGDETPAELFCRICEEKKVEEKNVCKVLDLLQKDKMDPSYPVLSYSHQDGMPFTSRPANILKHQYSNYVSAYKSWRVANTREQHKLATKSLRSAVEVLRLEFDEDVEDLEELVEQNDYDPVKFDEMMIRMYTGSLYEYMNGDLATNYHRSLFLHASFALDGALARLPYNLRVTDECVRYIRLGERIKFFKDHLRKRPFSPIRFSAFSSTSIGRDRVFGNSDTRIIIEPCGRSVEINGMRVVDECFVPVYGYRIDGFSEHKDENEVVFPPGMKVFIKSVEKVEGKDYKYEMVVQVTSSVGVFTDNPADQDLRKIFELLKLVEWTRQQCKVIDDMDDTSFVQTYVLKD